MKKSIIALSIACAGAFAFADPVVKPDNTQWQEPWFHGLVNPSAVGTLGEVNATWSGLSAEKASVANSKLTLDLDTTDVATLTVGGTTAAADTDTQDRISFTALLTPIAAGELPTAASFGDSVPQTGFALAYTTVSDTTTYQYYAFKGDAWLPLYPAVGTTAPTAESTVVIDVKYWESTRYASYTVGNTTYSYDSTDASLTNVTLTTTDPRNISSIDIKGSGTISAIDGAVQLGVAQLGTRKYGTLAEAVAASDSMVGQEDRNVTVLLANNESVTINNPHTVIEDPNGKAGGTVTPGSQDVEVKVKPTKSKDNVTIAASGAYTLSTKVTSDEALANVTIVLPNANKEVASKVRDANNNVMITIQTATSILTDGAAKPTGAATPTVAGIAGLRDYLNTYANAAYVAGDVSSASIKTALETVPDVSAGSNGLELWKLCAMGITPTTKLQPMGSPAGQKTAGKIKLSLPEIAGATANGDYQVNYGYKLDNGEFQAIVGTLSEFEIPTSTAGTYHFGANIIPNPVK